MRHPMPYAGRRRQDSGEVRVLDERHLDAFLALCAQSPVINVFAEYRARTTRLDPRWLGGEMWGRFDGDTLVAACHVGANFVPVQADAEDCAHFAEYSRGSRPSASTLVGPEPAVAELWAGLRGSWPQPREERWGQRHLQIAGPPAVAADPQVRLSTREDLEILYPACVAMYTEEVGESPENQGGGPLYRARVSQLISRRWSFVRVEQGRVVFKAEVASATPSAAQIQGVYVVPDRRGEGLANAGMAAVVQLAREQIAPVVSLYVNEWNHPARRAYERVGFEETARFATLMF